MPYLAALLDGAKAGIHQITLIKVLTLTENKMTQQQVQARVDDWMIRVHRLYDQIKDWLKPLAAVRFDEHQNATLYEELMQKFGISPQPMPTLDIYEGDHLIARLKPIGLWIIGANGRVDLMSHEGGVILVDESQPFQPSQWVAHDKHHFKEGRNLTSEYFLTLLGLRKHECV